MQNGCPQQKHYSFIIIFFILSLIILVFFQMPLMEEFLCGFFLFIFFLPKPNQFDAIISVKFSLILAIRKPSISPFDDVMFSQHSKCPNVYYTVQFIFAWICDIYVCHFLSQNFRLIHMASILLVIISAKFSLIFKIRKVGILPSCSAFR